MPDRAATQLRAQSAIMRQRTNNINSSVKPVKIPHVWEDFFDEKLFDPIQSMPMADGRTARAKAQRGHTLATPMGQTNHAPP
jgi:hypothetical protein